MIRKHASLNNIFWIVVSVLYLHETKSVLLILLYTHFSQCEKMIEPLYDSSNPMTLNTIEHFLHLSYKTSASTDFKSSFTIS